MHSYRDELVYLSRHYQPKVQQFILNTFDESRDGLSADRFGEELGTPQEFINTCLSQVDGTSIPPDETDSQLWKWWLMRAQPLQLETQQRFFIFLYLLPLAVAMIRLTIDNFTTAYDSSSTSPSEVIVLLTVLAELVFLAYSFYPLRPRQMTIIRNAYRVGLSYIFLMRVFILHTEYTLLPLLFLLSLELVFTLRQAILRDLQPKQQSFQYSMPDAVVAIQQAIDRKLARLHLSVTRVLAIYLLVRLVGQLEAYLHFGLRVFSVYFMLSITVVIGLIVYLLLTKHRLLGSRYLIFLPLPFIWMQATLLFMAVDGIPYSPVQSIISTYILCCLVLIALPASYYMGTTTLRHLGWSSRSTLLVSLVHYLVFLGLYIVLDLNSEIQYTIQAFLHFSGPFYLFLMAPAAVTLLSIINNSMRHA